ncbi:MAG: flavin reductase [Erysipelotrichaceae bacterium]|nr:flavin reductase [Erysipelotrichaceae bacterium]
MDYTNKAYKVFEMFAKQKALATAGSIDDYNCCTIGWGSLGNIWDRGTNIVTININPDRYTWEYCMNKDTFSVCFFPEEYHDDLMILGTKSGRDGDKVALTKLHPISRNDAVIYEEAKLSFICKKLYQGEFAREGLADKINNGIYKAWRPHYMFVGEIIEVIGGE